MQEAGIEQRFIALGPGAELILGHFDEGIVYASGWWWPAAGEKVLLRRHPEGVVVVRARERRHVPDAAALLPYAWPKTPWPQDAARALRRVTASGLGLPKLVPTASPTETRTQAAFERLFTADRTLNVRTLALERAAEAGAAVPRTPEAFLRWIVAEHLWYARDADGDTDLSSYVAALEQLVHDLTEQGIRAEPDVERQF